jgi:RecG-like helicase
VIDEMPKNRKPIKTVLRGEKRLPRFSSSVEKEGRIPNFIVYPLLKSRQAGTESCRNIL